jgi:O-methyltransferase
MFKIMSSMKNFSVRHFREVVRVAWSSTYAEDGLIARRLASFLRGEKFTAAYNAGKSTGSWGRPELRWRVFVACWAAGHAKLLPGDFVECGVNRGGISRAVMEYTDFSNIDKTFYLLDTYCGVPERMKRSAADVNFNYSECYDEVRETFSQFPNVRIIRGAVPETLSSVDSEKIAYLSIDMNCVEPEIAAAEFFWDKMAPSGVILLDDYCYSEDYTLQHNAFNEFAKLRGAEVLPLPTGQGLIVKA